MKLAILALLPCAVWAACPNMCSGNGRCSNNEMQFSATSATSQINEVPSALKPLGWSTVIKKKDSCTCFTRVEDGKTVYAYTGADCSLLTCPYGNSWDGQPYENDNHNQMMECSGRGICDRKTGECDCFAGYEGKGCRRSTCPNDCSFHGTCKDIQTIAFDLSLDVSGWEDFSEFDYTNIQYDSSWDSAKIRGCVCDMGWRGPDCSIKEAPSGQDPMGGPGAEEGRVCSGRGYNENGRCHCYTGFFGAACDQQRANVA